MEIKDIADVSSSVKSWYAKGRDAARQNNYSYAVEMLRTCLKAEPGLMEARELLRSTAISQVGKLGGFKANLVNVKNALVLNVKIPGLIKKEEYVEAMDLAELVLSQDPFNVTASRLLAQSAEECGLVPVAIFTIEQCLKSGLKDEPLMAWLSDLYIENGQSEKSVPLCRVICSYFPDSRSAEARLKDVIAKSAMDSGGLSAIQGKPAEEEPEAVVEEEVVDAPTDSSVFRVVRKERSEVSEYLEQIEAGQDSISLRKKLSKVYLKEEKHDEAIECLKKAQEMGGAADPSLVRDLHRAYIAKFDFAIKAWNEHAEKGAEEKAQADAEIAKIEEQKADFLLTITREKAEKYKNDANVSMELANLLWDREEYDEAIKYFHKAEGSNRHRFMATYRKGQCLIKCDKPKEAAETFKSAINDARTNEQRLEVLYDLAKSLKTEGKEDEAHEYFEEIKRLDANYRDVASLSS